MNLAVGCHYFLSGLRLSSQITSVITFGQRQFNCLVNLLKSLWP